MTETVSNMKFGITNADKWTNALGTYIAPAPSYATEFFDDFLTYYVDTTDTSGDWTVTKTGTGTAALQNAAGGIIKLTNSTANNDALYLQWAGGTAATIEPLAFVSGQRTWFEAAFQVNNATNAAWIMGLQITDTTPEAVSDGVWFSKAAASTSISFNVAASSVQTTNTAVATMANATQIVLSFYFDGVQTLTYYVNGAPAGKSSIANLTTHTLTPSFGVRNGTAAAVNMSVDYIFSAYERNQTPAIGS